MKLKRQQVRVALHGPAKLSEDGGEYIPTVEYTEVKALASTKIPFAITRLDGRWSLTHIPSGYSLGSPYYGGFTTQQEAYAALEILEDVSTPDMWAGSDGDISNPTDAQRSVAVEFKRRLSQ